MSLRTRPAAHDADDHVRHEHHHAQGEDHRADGRALPPVAEERDLGLVSEALAHTPKAVVPMKKMVSGMTSPEEEAISP